MYRIGLSISLGIFLLLMTGVVFSQDSAPEILGYTLDQEVISEQGFALRYASEGNWRLAEGLEAIGGRGIVMTIDGYFAPAPRVEIYAVRSTNPLATIAQDEIILWGTNLFLFPVILQSGTEEFDGGEIGTADAIASGTSVSTAVIRLDEETVVVFRISAPESSYAALVESGDFNEVVAMILGVEAVEIAPDDTEAEAEVEATPEPTSTPEDTEEDVEADDETVEDAPLGPEYGDLLFEETFDNNDNEWEIRDDDDILSDIIDGEYVMEIREEISGWVVWWDYDEGELVIPNTFDDEYIFEVDVSNLVSDTSAVCIAIYIEASFDSNDLSATRVTFCDEGSYGLLPIIPGIRYSGVYRSSRTRVQSNADLTQRLRITVTDDTYEFAIDGEVLGSLSRSFSNRGDEVIEGGIMIGLLNFSEDTTLEDASVAFDNMRVYEYIGEDD